MTAFAYFGHNVGDAAVRRRVVALRRAGFDVTGFMHRRGDARAEVDWPLVDLGATEDGAYLRRLSRIAAGARTALQHEETLRRAEILMARNLDMLAVAARVKTRLKLTAPLIYECLDIHHALSGEGMAARALRAVEGRLLKSCALVALSSPAFEREHFERRYAGGPRCFLVENRLIEGDAFPARPAASAPPARSADAPLRLGWFGVLRCVRSLGLITDLAGRFGDRLEITLRGYPATGVFEDFEGALAPHSNIRFEGRYRAPQDLAEIYGGVDLVWAGDWYETGANSLWLLPNRIYEGGYFATPAIAPGGTETARWLEARGAGFTLADPVEETLPALIAELIADRASIAAQRERLLALPIETFVEGPDTMRAMAAAARGG